MIQVEGKKGRERPKIKLVKVIKKDMSIMEVTMSMVLDIIECRKRLYVVNPASLWEFIAVLEILEDKACCCEGIRLSGC